MHVGAATGRSRLIDWSRPPSCFKLSGHSALNMSTIESCCHPLIIGRMAPSGNLRFNTRNNPRMANPRKIRKMAPMTDHTSSSHNLHGSFELHRAHPSEHTIQSDPSLPNVQLPLVPLARVPLHAPLTGHGYTSLLSLFCLQNPSATLIDVSAFPPPPQLTPWGQRRHESLVGTVSFWLHNAPPPLL